MTSKIVIRHGTMTFSDTFTVFSRHFRYFNLYWQPKFLVSKRLKSSKKKQTKSSKRSLCKSTRTEAKNSCDEKFFSFIAKIVGHGFSNMRVRFAGNFIKLSIENSWTLLKSIFINKNILANFFLCFSSSSPNFLLEIFFEAHSSPLDILHLCIVYGKEWLRHLASIIIYCYGMFLACKGP